MSFMCFSLSLYLNLTLLYLPSESCSNEYISESFTFIVPSLFLAEFKNPFIWGEKKSLSDFIFNFKLLNIPPLSVNLSSNALCLSESFATDRLPVIVKIY
mgnify:CR=1 FL=1